MKKIVNICFITLLCLISVIPAKAQLFDKYKFETASITYYQFPVVQERCKSLTVEVIQENDLGKAASSIIKSDRINNALTGESGIFADEHTVREPIILIPSIFPTSGDLYMEVNYSNWSEDKKSLSLDKTMYRYVKNGIQINAIVSYKLYLMPEKKLIYTQKPIWVESYIQKSSSSQSSSSAMLGGNELEAALKNVAEGWATKQIVDKYSIAKKSISIPVYITKGLDRDDKKQSEDIQEKMLGLISSYRYSNQSDEYVASVKECISFWEDQLKNYTPGTTKKKESVINDKNAWCLYYNIAVANLLIGHTKTSASNMKKCMALNKINKKEFFNKKGEKKGEATFMYDAERHFYFYAVNNTLKNYFDGINNMNPEFVALLTTSKMREATCTFAREISANTYISEIMGLEIPAEFTSDHLSLEQPKMVKETISDKNINVNATIKKQMLYFLTHKYSAKYATDDMSVKTKQLYSSRMIPYTFKTDFGLVKSVDHYKAKTNDKKKIVGSSHFMYDYNGDILLNQTIFKDRGGFITWCKITDADALEVKYVNYRIKHNDLNPTSIQIETQTIERSRDLSWFTGFIEKLISKEPFETTELSNNTDNEKITYKKNKITLVTNGKSNSGNYNVTTDDKDNWIEIIANDQVSKRTIVY